MSFTRYQDFTNNLYSISAIDANLGWSVYKKIIESSVNIDSFDRYFIVEHYDSKVIFHSAL